MRRLTQQRVARARELAAAGHKAAHIAAELGLSVGRTSKILSEHRISLGRWSPERKARLATERLIGDETLDSRQRAALAARAELSRVIAAAKAEWHITPPYRGHRSDL